MTGREVCVTGGGPAGSVCALRLARLGRTRDTAATPLTDWDTCAIGGRPGGSICALQPAQADTALLKRQPHS